MTAKQTVVFVLAAAALAACGEKHPYSRYQSIVDRQMFGELPPGFDPTKPPSEVARGGGKQEKELTKEQEKLQSSIHFSMINLTPDGSTAVGFTDNSNPKAPVHYYLKVGESRDGWKVEEADAKAATMKVVKGDVEVSLTLGGNSGKGGGQTQARGAQPGASRGDGGQAGLSGSGLLGTLRGRRAMRERKAEAAQAAELQKLREEQAAKDEAREARAAEENARREAEREEQRKQLQAIQEELRKAREDAAKRKDAEEAGSDANNDSE